MYRLSEKFASIGIKKIFAIILAALMIFASLSACKKDESGNKGTSTGSSTVAKTTAKTTAKTIKSDSTVKTGTNSSNKTSGTQNISDNGPASSNPADSQTASGNSEGDNVTQGSNTDTGSDGSLTAEEKIDLGGRTLIFADWNMERLVLDGGAGEKQAWYDSLKYQEQKYNFKLEFKQIKKGTEEFISSTLAGVKFADVFYTMSNMVFPKAANCGLLLQIDDYLDFNNDPKWIGRNANGKWKGKSYGIWYKERFSNMGAYCNLDLLDREGIPDPYYLWKNGNWNWDTFLDIALATTKDINGDAILDQWGLTETSPLDNAKMLVYSNGGDIVTLNGDKYQYAFSDSKCINAMQFLSDLYNVYKVVVPGYWQQYAKGASAFMFTSGAQGGRFKEAGLNNFSYIPLPKGPDGTTDIINRKVDMAFVAFPSNIENPREVVKVIGDFLAIWDETKPYFMPYETMLTEYTNTMLAKPERDIEYMRAASEIMGQDYMGIFPEVQNLIKSEIAAKIINQSTTVAAALESVREAAQQAIDAAENDRW